VPSELGDRGHDHDAQIGEIERVGDLVGGDHDVGDLAFADRLRPGHQIRDRRRHPVHLLVQEHEAAHFRAAQHQE
jgi:hypothetical protein